MFIKKFSFLIFFSIFVSFYTFADEIGYTESGKKVLLKSNNTWNYINEENDNNKYPAISWIDFFVDVENYYSKPINIIGFTGITESFLNTERYGGKRLMLFDVKKLPKALRKTLHRCRLKKGCKLSVSGRVSDFPVDAGMPGIDVEEIKVLEVLK